MNRTALSIALALVLGFGLGASPPASADEGPDLRPLMLETVPAPSWFAEAPEGGVTPIDDPDEPGPITAKGRRSISEERALLDARSQLERAVSEWLAPEIPDGWPLPEELVDALILDRHVEPVLFNLDLISLSDDPDLALPKVLHIAAIRADFSPDRREAFLEARRQQVGAERLSLLGGVAGFVLSCLAILTLYIRADEATRGYYTNRLRLVALSSAAGAGVLIYRLVS